MPEEVDPLSERQLQLLEGLRGAERSGRPIDLAGLAERSGYTESSIRTYFTKKLEGVLVFRGEDGEWRARGAVRCSEEEFARRMSQKAGASNDALRTEEAWRAVVRKLLYEGHRRRYTLAREELELVEALRAAARQAPPAEEVPVQASLFELPGLGTGERKSRGRKPPGPD